ncbi:hypothetical protein LPJ73_001535 [Coemansia sp. RSA 2703]|nr:hypothetical protein LPJ73_001535 [Coemansia sp. RSA 2703]KAJ2366979.1 hypothetical protein IW150_005794 [Coemansia sp. RSA 2607]KAJ2387734.1 hypothetical protein GGI05_003999 [Coemansia sp. RSA 2603]
MLSASVRQASRRITLGHSVRTLRVTTMRFKSTVPTTTTDKEIAIEQAPNRQDVWSADQRPRSDVVNDPRFIQADLLGQPRPMAAIELIAEEPVRQVETRLACCDGGGGALGHPRVWINLDDGHPQSCGYCGLRFQMKPHHHH